MLLVRLPALLALSLCSFIQRRLLPRELLQWSAFFKERARSARLEGPGLGAEASWIHERLGVVVWSVALRRIARMRAAFIHVVIECL